MKCIKCGVEISGEKCSRCGFDFTSESFVFFGVANPEKAILEKYRLLFQKEIISDNPLQERIRELEKEVASLKRQLQAAQRNTAMPNRGGTNVEKTSSKPGVKDIEKQRAKPADAHIDYEKLSTPTDLFNALDNGSMSLVMGKDYQLRPNYSGLVYLEPGEKKINQLYKNAEKVGKISKQRFRTIISCFLILNTFPRIRFAERFTDGRVLNKNLTKLYASYLIDEKFQNRSMPTDLIQVKRNDIAEIINKKVLQGILDRMSNDQRLGFERLRNKEDWGTTYIQSKGEWRMEILQAMVRYAFEYLGIQW